MQLAPATLSTITAILSAQGVAVTHDQLQNALAPLTGEKTVKNTPIALREDEYYLLCNKDGDEPEEFNNHEELIERLTELYNDGDFANRDSWRNQFDDCYWVHIARHQVSFEAETSVKIGLS